MSLPHAAPGELISLQPLGDKLPESVSTALLKSNRLEVMRLVLAAGKSIPEHKVLGELTMQCLEGAVEFRAYDKAQLLRTDEMVFLEGNVPYSLHAVENCSLLVTIALVREADNLDAEIKQVKQPS